jgi:hypothetical protein
MIITNLQINCGFKVYNNINTYIDKYSDKRNKLDS